MQPKFDNTWKDVVLRLKDDDLITPNLLKHASDIIERFGSALEHIKESGINKPGHGRTCSRIAETVLEGTYSND